VVPTRYRLLLATLAVLPVPAADAVKRRTMGWRG
jgi:hypothetical protein